MRDPPVVGIVRLPTIEDAVKAGGFLAGRPEDIIEALRAIEQLYPGLDGVICATQLGIPLDVQLADLDRFAKEVIPAFRDIRTTAAAGVVVGSAGGHRARRRVAAAGCTGNAVTHQTSPAGSNDALAAASGRF